MRIFPLAAALALLGCATSPTDRSESASDNLKLNQIQVLGTHNSYARPADKRLLAQVDPIIGGMIASLSQHMRPEDLARFNEEHPHGLQFAEGLNYDHPNLTTQLDAGVRSVELDLNPDPEGGHYLHPAGLRVLQEQGVTDLAPFDTTGLEAPGFKVLHVVDIDFRSHCPALRACLTEVRTWSDAHPDHAPLFILIEAKTQAMPILPEATPAIPFDAAQFDALDAEILSVIDRGRIITPDDVRGEHPTLNAAIRAGAWPRLADARGKILFLMITATGPASTLAYLDGHPSLAGRVAFLRAEPGEDHAAFLMLDNVYARQDEITRYVREGYLVRTRSDIETHEAKVNDMTRANAAFASGAQIVSTDFFRPGNVYGTPYVVRLPGGGEARCNPVIANPACGLNNHDQR